jgi:O-antigen/teichoic acid export membrane protein
VTERSATVAADPALTDGQHLARGAAANAVILVAANFRAIFTFLIARVLGAAAFGRFGVAFATTELLSKAGMLGFDSSVVPMVAAQAADGDGDGCRRVFRRALIAGAGASALLAAIVFGLIVAATEITAGSLVGFLGAFANGGAVMVWALPGIAAMRIATGAARGVLSMRNEFYSRGVTETWVTIGVFLAAIAIGLRDRAPALAVVAGTSAGAVVAVALARRSLAAIPVRAPADSAGVTTLHRAAASTGTMLAYSLPTAGSSLLNVLVTEADVLLLAFYVGRAPGVTPETFGVFAAAAQIAVGLRKVRQIFDPIFAPVVATRSISEHRERLRDTVAGPGRWVLAAQLPLVGALVLSGGAVMSIYGREYAQGGVWLALLAVAHGSNTFAGLVETLLMIERPGLNLINAVVTVAIQVVAGIVLIPVFGVTGAAIAMCLGFASQGVLRFAELRHVYGWSWPWRTLRRPTVAFMAAFVPALGLRLLTASTGSTGEIASGLLFLVLYALIWRVVGAEPDDREIWRLLRAGRTSVSSDR